MLSSSDIDMGRYIRPLNHNHKDLHNIPPHIHKGNHKHRDSSDNRTDHNKHRHNYHTDPFLRDNRDRIFQASGVRGLSQVQDGNRQSLLQEDRLILEQEDMHAVPADI